MNTEAVRARNARKRAKSKAKRAGTFESEPVFHVVVTSEIAESSHWHYMIACPCCGRPIRVDGKEYEITPTVFGIRTINTFAENQTLPSASHMEERLDAFLQSCKESLEACREAGLFNQIFIPTGYRHTNTSITRLVVSDCHGFKRSTAWRGIVGAADVAAEIQVFMQDLLSNLVTS